MSKRNFIVPKKASVALGASLLSLTTTFSPSALADAFIDALQAGKVSGDILMRHESVDQKDPSKDANALTLRTLLSYTTGDLSGFSATIGFHDVRDIAGVDDYNSKTNNKTSDSVIADPETTELDQGFIQYKNDMVTAKLGRQVITYDNHRFVGHVGWRQDRQTFNALTAAATPIENLSLNYAYINKRNRILAETADLDSKDHLLNASYKTPVGTVTGYGYFLEQDDDSELTIDTIGIRFSGATDMDKTKILYTAEFATQDKDNAAGAEASADYLLLEAGVSVAGITGKLGYEVLGSDDSNYGFSTPLATLHAFNGWTDQFLNTPNVGLVDTYFSVGGQIPGGGSLTVVYHDFEADDSTPTIDDLGDELGIVYAQKFGNNYNAGIKYATYDAGDTAAGYVDTDKLWVWVGLSF